MIYKLLIGIYFICLLIILISQFSKYQITSDHFSIKKLKVPYPLKKYNFKTVIKNRKKRWYDLSAYLKVFLYGWSVIIIVIIVIIVNVIFIISLFIVDRIVKYN